MGPGSLRLEVDGFAAHSKRVNRIVQQRTRQSQTLPWNKWLRMASGDAFSAMFSHRPPLSLISSNPGRLWLGQGACLWFVGLAVTCWAAGNRRDLFLLPSKSFSRESLPPILANNLIVTRNRGTIFKRPGAKHV